MQQTYLHQFPENFEQNLKRLLDDNNQKELAELLNSCRIDHKDEGFAAYHERTKKGNVWNKNALDLTIYSPNQENNSKLKTKENVLREFIDKILSSNETGFIVKNIDFMVDSKIDNIQLPENDDDNLQTLNKDIQEKLAQNQPELALDRLHTYATRYLRKLCEKYQIPTTKPNGENLPLQSLMGGLVRKYEEKNEEKNFLSEFSITALRSNISVFERYNNIRNNYSYAHDNEILNKNDAQLAITTIINLLNCIDNIENSIPNTSLVLTQS